MFLEISQESEPLAGEGTRSFPHRAAKLLLLLGVILLLVACGKKTNPKPPHEVRPKPPKKVQVKLHPWGAELSFKIPRRKVNGRPLDKLKEFKVLRFGETLEGPKAKFRQEIDIPLSEEDFEKRKYIVYEDRQLRSGVRYFYRIWAIKGWRCVSDPVDSPAFAWHTPPKAPVGFSAQGGDAEVRLKWEPVSEFLDETPVEEEALRYRLYRRLLEGSYKMLPELIEETSYVDRDVENEKTYCYRVSGVFEYYGTLIEGPKSYEVCATPHDVTPPRPPQGVVAIPFKKGVLVKWFRNTEEDLLGYYVYRKAPGRPAERLNDQPIEETSFYDENVPGPGFYYYWVTAVDNSPRRNESPPSEKAPVEILPKED